ncbi:MAG: hypothetical protein SF123_09250 [Chloroflexota bacterium]|nr:hypothetical protein [Chloroflexota bacterium]
MQIRPRNTGWLAAIGAMVGVAALSPTADPLGIGLLLAVFGTAAVATLVEFRPARLVERSRSSLTALRMSPEAREAVERAKRRGSGLHSSVVLLDVGLITSHETPDGLVMRRGRDLSKDDDGVRPFAVLHVPPEDAERTAIVRFEFIDRDGRQQYVHEMNAYLRDGEMNLLPDRQMPLFENQGLPPGEWDLRIHVDNRLIGAYGFMIAPSLEDRFPRAARERAERRLSAETKPDEPLRLEDLLREQSQRQGKQ